MSDVTEETIIKLQEMITPPVLKKLVMGLALVLILLWFASGIYTVDSGEEAVVLRFGQHASTVRNAGLKWHLPLPIERVYKEKVSEVKRLEFGFRTVASGNTEEFGKYMEMEEESLMITGDENLVDLELIIQFRVTDVENWFFKVDDQLATIRTTTESIIRRVVANHKLDDVLTDNKFQVQQEIQLDLQQIFEKYELGVTVTAVQLQDVNPPEQVEAAFKDVAAAREDKNSYINEAQAYANEIIPQARGEAAEITNNAEAYKQKRIKESNGDVANFLQVWEQYKSSQDITRARMYFETMEEILPGIEKYILEDNGDGTLRFLPLTKSTGREGQQ